MRDSATAHVRNGMIEDTVPLKRFEKVGKEGREGSYDYDAIMARMELASARKVIACKLQGRCNSCDSSFAREATQPHCGALRLGSPNPDLRNTSHAHKGEPTLMKCRSFTRSTLGQRRYLDLMFCFVSQTEQTIDNASQLDAMRPEHVIMRVTSTLLPR